MPIPLTTPQGKVIHYCPFGCTTDNDKVDEMGYCDHLLGFTADGKTFEPLYFRYDGRPFVSSHKGHKLGLDLTGPMPVIKGDILVNPEFMNKDGTIGRAGHSSRVYRKSGRPKQKTMEAPEPPTEPETEVEETENELTI